MNNKVFPLVLMLSLIACCIEVEVAIPGFLEMAQAFQVSESSIQYTLIMNLLGFAIGALVYGPLSDGVGRRPVMLIGNLILCIGAGFCVVAPSLPMLYLARLIQGIGAATSAVVVFAMIADRYEKFEAVRILGVFNAIFTLCMAAAPLLGSWINQFVGWRGNYGIIALLSLLSWWTILLYLPETHPSQQPISIQKSLQIYKRLLSHKVFCQLSLIPSLLYATHIVFMGFSAFLYRETFSQPLFTYSVHVAGIILSFALSSLFNARILAFFGEKFTLRIGLFCCVIGSFLFLISNAVWTNPVFHMTLSMCLLSIGSALTYPIIFNRSLEIFPALKGAATSVIMCMRTLLIAFCLAITSWLYDGTPESLALVVCLLIGSVFILLRQNDSIQHINSEINPS